MNVAYDLGDDAWRQLGVEALRQGNTAIIIAIIITIWIIRSTPPLFLSFNSSPGTHEVVDEIS